jgi:hypothetical protein
MNDQFPHDTANEMVECPRCLKPISDHDRDEIGNGLVRYTCPGPGVGIRIEEDPG